MNKIGINGGVSGGVNGQTLSVAAPMKPLEQMALIIARGVAALLVCGGAALFVYAVKWW